MCYTDSLTLDTAIFALPAFTYYIKDAAGAFSWYDSAAISDNSLVYPITCGTFTWKVLKDDGVTEIDSTVFTAGDFTQAKKTIDVFTSDFAKAGTYNMQVKVWYTELPTISKI